MKNKSLSLKWKLFFAIFLFAALIILIFVIFQIALLDRFYRSNKINRTNKIIYEVSELVDRKDMTDFTSSTSLSNELEKISMNEEAAIYLYAMPTTTKIGDDEVYLDTLVYKTISGSSLSKLDPELVNLIWSSAKCTPYTKFYAIMAVNYDPLFKMKILSVDTPNRILTKDMSNQNDSIMCCSFVKLADDLTYLLIIDNKIIPVASAVSTLKQQLTYITIIVSILSIVLAILIAKYISKPISKINDTTKEMAKGNYDVAFDGKGYSEINELNDTLNSTVSELKKTDTLRKELMANVSHDLRTPLTMIKGYAEMMKDLPGENNATNLQVIIDEVNRLNVLVTDMLDLSRLSSKTIELHMQRFSITDNLCEIVERYQRFQENKDFEITFKYSDNVEVIADESKINQVIYNFINNAINYSSDVKKVEIIQEIRNKTVRISVKDYGVGISKDDLTYIWDRYYRIDKGHKRSIQGSGLGLSIVKSILEYHNFEYGVTSSEGIGTEFYFEMPLAK